jgi:hypothetical protein
MADENTTTQDRDRDRARARRDNAEEPTSPQVQAEKSLTESDEPFVVRTISEEEFGSERPDGPPRVNGTDGEDVEAANGLPYRGVSEDWVRLTPKD